MKERIDKGVKKLDDNRDWMKLNNVLEDISMNKITINLNMFGTFMIDIILGDLNSIFIIKKNRGVT